MKTGKHIVIDGRLRSSGAGRVVDRFLHYLPQIDSTNRYSILVDPADKITFKASNLTAVPCPIKRYSMNPLDQIRFSWQLYRLKPDLVFFTMTGFAPLFYFGKNITLTHDLTMLRYTRAGRLPGWLHRLRMLGYRLLFWKGNYFAKRILVPTNFVNQDLSTYSQRLAKKICVTYEASDPPLKVKSEKIHDERLEKPFIMHLGSPFPHKNIENLVKAFEHVKKSQPNLILVLAGKKEFYFSELEEWTKNRPYANDIVFTGFISDAELKWLYEAAECYVLPSLSEGFGLPGLEAMAHNCPLVSSNTTCLPEVYGEAAHYFNPTDVDDISRAISEVIGSKSVQQKLVNAGKKQLKQYSWQKMTSEIVEVFEEVLQ